MVKHQLTFSMAVINLPPYCAPFRCLPSSTFSAVYHSQLWRGGEDEGKGEK